MTLDHLPDEDDGHSELKALRDRCAALEKELATLRHESKALWQSEQAFRQMLREVPLLFVAFDAAGVVFHWNKECELVTGYSKEEMVGNPRALELTYPDETYRDFVAEIVRHPDCELRNEELTMTTKSGEARVIAWSDISARVPIPGWKRWTIGHDVTQRRLAEEALTEANERMRALFLGARDAIFIADAETGAILDINPPAEKLVGRPKEELIGKAITYIHPRGEEEHHKRIFRRIVDTSESDLLETEILTASGEIVPVEISPSVIVLRGGKRVVQGFVRDLSGRKRDEQALRESEERYRALFDGATDAILVHRITADGRPGLIIAANDVACHRLGYSRSELEGLAIDALDAPESRLEVRRMTARLLMGQDALFEQVHIGKDGRRIPVEVHAQQVMYDGEPAVLSVVRDISERKRAEEEKVSLEGQLRHAQKMESIGRLAGGIAHDFNNLLTSISGNVELAIMEISPRDPIYPMLQEVGHAAESAAALTRQLLAFSRKQIIEPRILDLNELIERMHKMLVRLIGEDIRLSTLPGKDLANVNADPGQLEQVIINLAVNARDAMPTGGRLSIATGNTTLDEDYCRSHVDAIPGDYVVLIVSDTGCGMTQEVKSHLFEPFYTTKPRGKGTGLGLATIYGVVKQNGGSIEVYTEEGKGTAFKIYLPRIHGEAKPLMTSGLKSLALGQETVLLVEDEQVVRDLANRFLQKLGYQVLPHANANEALLAARNFPGEIHLLLTDVVMPGMNGPALATELLKFRPSLKVLFASGYTEDAIVNHGMLAEGIQFIGKPYSIHVLAQKLRDVLAAR